MRWVLPEYIQDVLPDEASTIEHLRRGLLDAFAASGYQLVQPPLLEYMDSLLTGAGRDLRLRTVQLVDQLSGRTMGVRADMTPQVARIDAHLLNRRGVTRLCYCGSVLHTLPASLSATREPLQVGAELYGHSGLEADAEILRLLAEALAVAGVAQWRLDLGHMGLFRALAKLAGLSPEREEIVFDLLQSKDLPSLAEALSGVPKSARSALLALPGLYGGREVLAQARSRLPSDSSVLAAVGELERLAEDLTDLPVSFDLSDLRGYHYHSGVVFAAYGGGQPGAIALGGRYDLIGQHFGRGRPATGFSMDLRQLALSVTGRARSRAILAPAEAVADGEVARLRGAGEVVMQALPGHDGTWREAGCDRQLVRQGGHWMVLPLEE
ncbi:MAG: ATP phosphoribosyltransferase regulatory subunit [Zoogloeaceae bacterium]|nr:ATP phosphoribosyltransferase regulatory subunit [Zoogloeaceae bacterium]